MATPGKLKGCSCNESYNSPAMGPVPPMPHSKGESSTNAIGSPFASGSPTDIPKSESVRQPSAQEPDKDQESLDPDEEIKAKFKNWVSPLRKFDVFATGELRRREIAEEDFPRLKVPQMKGHHKCKVSSLLSHNVDYAVDMEQELRNIGIQETHMLDMLEKLTKAEAAVRFQGAVRAAEVAAMSAPPDLAEEAAVAGARGYSVETQEFSKKSSPGENPIEIIGYIGCTRPNNF